jgi:hypothetical protein
MEPILERSRNNLMSRMPMNSSILAYFYFFTKSRGANNSDVKELCGKVRKCGCIKISNTLRLGEKDHNMVLVEEKKLANLFRFFYKSIGLRTFS